MKPIEQVIAERAPALLAIDGVVGVFEGMDEDGGIVIRVAVARRHAALEARIPPEVDGYRIEVVETGPIGLH